MRYLILILPIIFYSCGNNTNSIEIKSENIPYEIGGREFEILTIDSCEYLSSYLRNNGAILTHKGNCKFCIQRNK